MAKLPLFNTIILLILISSILIDCKENKKAKKKEKKTKHKKLNKINKEENIDIIASSLEWAKNNSIYINKKLVLNKKINRDKYYYFSADSRILNNTLLLRVPYDMMISQYSLNEIYKNSKNQKFEKLWDNIMEIKSEYIKYFSTKQLLYMGIIIENAIRKKKGPVYKKYKEYLRMYDHIDLDIFPIFYDQQEKFYLSGSNFGSQINRATDSLNEEYYLSTNVLNLSIPFQDEFLKARVISLISSTDFNNTNLNYTNGFNETVIVPFLDCFKKAISDEKSNARFEILGKKNDTTNKIDYYLEVYSNDDIYIGGEINIKWRPFPNSELLLYYGIVEEGNPFSSRYYVDILNRKLKKDLDIPEDKKFDNVKRDMYEVNTEFYDPSVINTYRNISLNISKYKDREEGAYELMCDNLKSYLEVYNTPLSDGNINIYMNGDEKIKDIKEIMHMEKRLIERKIEYLENVIRGIKERNSGEKKVEEKNNENTNTDENKDENKDDL